MQKLLKLKKGDKVAILSPSFAAPGAWPQVYELGLERLRDLFHLDHVEFPTTRKIGATGEDRAIDLVAAFQDPEIKGVISSLGGDDQVTYVKNLPSEPFAENPKPFFGFSDNSHLCNFLFLNGVPSYYGASLFTQFAMQGAMDAFTVEYITHALFDEGEFELKRADEFNEIGLDWGDPASLQTRRSYVPNDDWYWDGAKDGEGLLWGGCIESVDEMLRHGVSIPDLSQFENIILMLESSEEIPNHGYVFHVLRALGERGILARVKGVLIGRPQSWDFGKQTTPEERIVYRREQQETIIRGVRTYNPDISIIQNLDFGHTNPQIPMPYGNKARIEAAIKKVFVTF